MSKGRYTDCLRISTRLDERVENIIVVRHSSRLDLRVSVNYIRPIQLAIPQLIGGIPDAHTGNRSHSSLRVASGHRLGR